MPQLLDLPPEILQIIMHELVIPDITQAWVLQNVCRTFAAEISYAFGRLNQAEMKLQYLEICEIRWLYLYYRAKVLLDARPEVPARVNKMVEWLSEKTGVKGGDEQTREQYTKALCKVVVKNVSAYKFQEWMGLEELTHSSRAELDNWTKAPLGLSEKIGAVAAIGHDKLLSELLEKCKSILHGNGTFGHPLSNAATSGHINIINVLSNYADEYGLTESASQPEVVPSSIRMKAIEDALSLGDVNVVAELVDFHRKSCDGKLMKRDYNEWLY
jgi:hypothetical protein